MSLAYFFGYSDFVVMLSRSLDVAPHTHHAMQITFGLDKPLTLQHDDQQITCQGIFIPSDTPHLVDSQSGKTINVLVHPESPLSTRLHQHFQGEITELTSATQPIISEVWDTLTCQHVYHALESFWQSFPTSQTPPIADSRIQQAITMIQRMEIVKVSAKTLADSVNLSPSRFMYLFRQETGIPLRRYLLWYRLISAAEQIMQQTSFTDAAHHAGFSDAAHLTRTFKQMFGLTPDEVFNRAGFVQAVFCTKSSTPA